MKKIFKFAAIFAMAALTLSAVSCSKDDDKDENKEDPKVDPPVVDDYAPVTGESDWSIIGSLSAHEKVNMNWDGDLVMVQDGDIYYVKNLKLAAADEFKIRFQKDWGVNRGGNFESLGNGFAVTHDGPNIKVGAEGTFDVYYNAALEQIAVCAANANPTWAEPQGPVASDWNYVMNISDYKTNSEFHFGSPVKLNPGSLTFQWKFYSTKWNVYDQVDEERGYKVWANRLGQISNSAEKGILLRFNDGHKQGSLRLNAAIFANDGKDYVQKDGDDYIWSLNEWHTLSIVADGSTVTVYDNAEAVYSFEYSVPEVYAEWPVERFDISMTWDDGTGYDKGQAFQGYQAYTRMWSRALSAEEIAASLCNVDTADGLVLCWNYNLEEGTTVKNEGSAASYDLDFTKALAGGQASYVKAEDIEGTWTPVEEIENGTVCAE